MDSPGFRPAFNDLTNEPMLPGTPTAPGNKEVTAEGKKRKSLGRRVSFAAKAKVRFIESEKEDNGGNNNSSISGTTDEIGDEDRVVNRENLEDDIFLSISRSHADPKNNETVSTEGSPMLLDSPIVTRLPVFPQSAEGEIITASRQSSRPVQQNQPRPDVESIEIEVKDPHSSSFSSFEGSESVLDDVYDEDEERRGAIGGGGNDDNNGGNEPCDDPTTASINNTTTASMVMEMTKCVGGIVSAIDRAVAANNFINHHYNNDDTMDLTKCIGGILNNANATSIGYAKNSVTLTGIPSTATTTTTNAVVYSPSSLDTTMEFTSTIQNSAVAGIFVDPINAIDIMNQTNSLANANHIRVSSDDPASPITFIPRARSRIFQNNIHVEEMMDSTMDLTSVLRHHPINPIVPAVNTGQSRDGALITGSPSPFLVTNNNSITLMSRMHSRHHRPDADSDLSFIGDMEQPAILDTLASPLPPPNKSLSSIPSANVASTKNQGEIIKKEEEGVDSMTAELFNKYIDTNRLRSMMEPPPPPLPSLPTNSESVIKLNKGARNEKKSSTTDPATPVTNNAAAPLPPSSATESPTVTLILPRASLKDFLMETGLSFIESFSSTNRRDTTGRLRDRESLMGIRPIGEGEKDAPGRKLHAEGGLMVEADILDDACRQVISMIGNLREQLSRQEEQFNHSPPLPFLEYRDPGERAIVISKMKTLKSLARLFAKRSWYEWRSHLHEQLNDLLVQNVTEADTWARSLAAKKSQLDYYLKIADEAITSITDKVGTLRDQLNFFTGEEMEEVRNLENLLLMQQNRLSTLDEEMAEMVAREAQLRESIEIALRERNELQTRHTALKQQVETMPDVSPLALDELKSSLNLLQGVVGWKIMRMATTTTNSHTSELQLCHLRSGVAITLTLDRPLEESSNNNENNETWKVYSMAFDVSSAKSRLLRHTPRIFKLPPGLAPKDALLNIGLFLDRLGQVDKQLAIVSVQCSVEVADSLLPDSLLVPITLRFFSAVRKCKFDLILGITGTGGANNNGSGGGNMLLPSGVSVVQCIVFYGLIESATVMERANLAVRSSKFHPIRRAVASILELVLANDSHLDLN